MVTFAIVKRPVTVSTDNGAGVRWAMVGIVAGLMVVVVAVVDNDGVGVRISAQTSVPLLRSRKIQDEIGGLFGCGWS
jgi:hypothetical protein